MDPIDPRAVRTDEALLEACYRLAAIKPIEEVTVTELCEEAGVSRVTFYRRARTPAELLSADFAERLRFGSCLFLDAQPTTTGPALLREVRATIEVLTSHVEQFAEIYANSVRVGCSVLGQDLRTAMITTIKVYVDSRRNEIALPPDLQDQPWPKINAMLAKSYASSTWAIIEEWLLQPAAERDRDELASWMLTLALAWNLRLIGLTEPSA